MGEGGVVLLGCAPAALFLMATCPDVVGAIAWGMGFVAVAGLAAARNVFRLSQSGVGHVLGVAWALVGVGIAGHRCGAHVTGCPPPRSRAKTAMNNRLRNFRASFSKNGSMAESTRRLFAARLKMSWAR